MKKSPTIRDIAREAAVSPATVSRVISGNAKVSPGKRSRVEAAVERLEYRPNPFTRNLFEGTSNTVGVLVPHFENEFYGQIVTGVEAVLRAQGLHMTCALGHYQAAQEQAALDRFLSQWVDGLLLIAPRIEDAALLELAEQGVPTVLVTRSLPELAAHSVRLDNVQGGYLATKHLLELGHRHIAHITGLPAIHDARERLEGYHLALREGGVTPIPQLVVEEGSDEEAGARALHRLIKLKPFTAIFAANDRLAVGALQALQKVGKKVPEEVSLVGFDDRSVARFMTPALTTVRYPLREIGERAACHLTDLINGRASSELLFVEPQLVVRASTTSLTSGN